MNKLKPCPFCGGESVVENRFIQGIANRKAYWIRCKICETKTHERNRENKAIEFWNNRHEGWIENE